MRKKGAIRQNQPHALAKQRDFVVGKADNIAPKNADAAVRWELCAVNKAQKRAFTSAAHARDKGKGAAIKRIVQVTQNLMPFGIGEGDLVKPNDFCGGAPL